MGTKLISEDAWSKFAKKHKLDRNKQSIALEKALKRFEELEEEEHDDHEKKWKQAKELQKVSQDIQSRIEQLKKEKEVKNCKEILSELSELNSYWRMKEKLLQQDVDRASQAAAAEVDEERSLLDRLVKAAQSISGSDGKRLQKVMEIAVRRGDPGYKSLWYYNYEAVGEFVQFHTTQERRREMTKSSNGKLPFKGSAGTHGDWVIEPFNNSSLKKKSDKDLVGYLQWMDGQIEYSMRKMAQVQATDSADAFGPSVDEFLKHVGSLAKDRSHMYSAGY